MCSLLSSTNLGFWFSRMAWMPDRRKRSMLWCSSLVLLRQAYLCGRVLFVSRVFLAKILNKAAELRQVVLLFVRQGVLLHRLHFHLVDASDALGLARHYDFARFFLVVLD